jgi:hypothetical protein
MPNQERSPKLDGLNFSTAFYSNIPVLKGVQRSVKDENSLPFSSSLGEYVESYLLTEQGRDRTERICRIVEYLGGDSLTIELAKAHNFHSLDTQSYLLENFSDPESMDTQGEAFVNSVLALEELTECLAMQQNNASENEEEYDLYPYLGIAYNYNGGLRRALLVKTAQRIDELQNQDETELPDDFDKEIKLYIDLLGLVEEHEGLKYIKDLYVEKNSPVTLDYIIRRLILLQGASQTEEHS